MSIPAYTQQLNNKGLVMSDYTKIPNQLITLKLPPAEKVVLIVIARYSIGFHKVQCDLSTSQIAEDSDLSKRSVYNAIASLEKKGLLSVVRGKVDGINTINSYQLIDLYSGEKSSLPSENNALWVVKNLHEGSAESAPSKESIKENINNNPPISPQGGQDAQQSSDVTESEATANQSETTASETVKRKAKASAELVNSAELDINSLANPLPFQADWMQDERMKATFREVLAEYQITDKETLIRIWKLLKGEFVEYWTGLKATSARAKKKCWVNTFRNHVRRQAEQNAWRWKKNESFLGESKAEKLALPNFDLSDGGTQLQKWAVAQGFRAAKQRENAWAYLEAVKAWVAEKNGGGV